MAYLIKPIEEERCVSLSYEGEIPPREIAAARYEAQGLLNARGWSRMMLDLTQLRSVPTASQLFDFAKGFSGHVPPDARVALVVRPEQVRDANLVEKVARKDGVFLSYFVDPEKAALWMQRSQTFRRRLRPEPRFQESQMCKPYPTISTRRQDPVVRKPHAHCTLCNRRCTANPDITRGTPQATVAET